ncbi:HD domain-containing phosphohydrolase [Desulfocurvus sp.]|uniref:GAF and HD-GYP domain-containing protein n=1 Tax=Desulfocurvus sp. TaxID=2871698 RepID=UPI0025C298AA|nr:HD domain-containing phosphohydrolase [Desulfocurvus sp.]MCK9240884.1 HD domain-containing protein [Desulfocurvus sp.]
MQPTHPAPDGAGLLREILAINESLSRLKDLDAILDRVLAESRRIAGADAGTIYLVENGRLRFGYVHNDTFNREGDVTRDVYADFTLPIDSTSIVGHVAATGQPLDIADAYAMPPDAPVAFNPDFDRRTGYRTTSMLTLPVTTSQGTVSGVIQLINAKDDAGRPVPFSAQARTVLPLLSTAASVAIERAIMTRELILRMMQMAELRDPSETGAHVTRVGAYSAEIYHKYAMMQGIDETLRKKTKDLIRVAAMLHDVGKVGISDRILKKPARLDPEEFAVMRMHTVFGARLFANSTSELDAMSGRIALNHHEKWNGTGYPGHLDGPADTRPPGPPRAGAQIPLEARIVALADVFDALGSRRSYKAPWPDEKIIDLLRSERGAHFDPDVVDAFLDIFDVIAAIRDKYAEDKPGQADG